MEESLNSTIDQPEKPPNINAKLAARAKVLWLSTQNKYKLDERLKALVIPGNCSFLEVPLTNEEIFRNLRKQDAA